MVVMATIDWDVEPHSGSDKRETDEASSYNEWMYSKLPGWLDLLRLNFKWAGGENDELETLSQSAVHSGAVSHCICMTVSKVVSKVIEYILSPETCLHLFACYNALPARPRLYIFLTYA